ncbi:hypothetical protein [Paraburkholderia strydomiana]|uniref:hypothetical protein n=1 Tax=Paraburkholderia strydomiana TaxID=1245417 RepID=UPI001BEA5594|nr:hypothetical protein [Paraburkholderia strydomiana]MBT2789184.1 hypothetical protein [Paraburkholderia strydomiana]
MQFNEAGFFQFDTRTFEASGVLVQFINVNRFRIPSTGKKHKRTPKQKITPTEHHYENRTADWNSTHFHKPTRRNKYAESSNRQPDASHQQSKLSWVEEHR